MTRSKQRKLKKNQQVTRSRFMRSGVPVASALLACMQAAYGADSAPVAGLDEIVVTAQKREQALIDVPYLPLGSYFQPTAFKADLFDMPKGLIQFTGVRRG